MNEAKKRTTKEFSQWLSENGCELESNMWWSKLYNPDKSEYVYFLSTVQNKVQFKEEFCIPAYDIANDICIKYAKEFFGEDTICGLCYRDAQACSSDNSDEIKKCEGGVGYSDEIHSHNILSKLQQGKKQEAEAYIREHCLFNFKNK